MFVGRDRVMQDLSSIASGLTLGPDGIWQARSSSAIDYPDEANAFCFAIEDRSFWFQHRNAVIVDLVRRFPPAGFIADIGAGNGYVSCGLKEAGFDTLVLEPGDAGIRNARSRGLTALVHATLQDAAFRAESLPAAGMFDVLEHIADDTGVLTLLHKALEPNGRLYLTVPSFQSLWSGEDEIAGHHRRYTTASLSARLIQTGFSAQFASYFFAPLPLPILFVRALPWRLGRRTTIEPERIATELRPSEGAGVRIVKSALAIERAVLERGWRIPMGSSCAVVARKR
jgi:SAM-dependent methyltransferase